MHKILIGGGGTGAAFALTSRLRAHWHDDVFIIITDTNPEHLVTTSVLADGFHQVPPASDPAFDTALKGIIQSEEITTYIPIHNAEMRAAWRLQAHDYGWPVDFWMQGPGAHLLDKRAADPWLESIGVRVPAGPDDLAKQAPGSQWFVKPRDGFGSTGARKETTAALARLPADEMSGLVVQEVCDHPEITIDSFYDATSGAVYAYCRERLETKAGVCTKARIFQDGELVDFAARIGAALQQRGIICFQAMVGQGGWCVTDLNLRAGGGTALTCAAGFDVLSASYACRIGEPYDRFLRPMTDKEEIFVTRQYSEFVMARRP